MFDRLDETWQAIRVEVKPKTASNKVAVVFAGAAHTHRLARAAMVLIDADFVAETSPLTRAVYECALTTHWAAQVDDSALQLSDQEIRAHRALVRELQEARLLDQIPPERRKLPSDQDQHITKITFEQICDDLNPGGDEAYAIYRILSAYSHATTTAIGRYLQPDDRQPLGFTASDVAEPEEPDFQVFLLVASLVWAGRAVDYFDSGHSRRSELRSAARAIGINSELVPSDKFHMRTI